MRPSAGGEHHETRFYVSNVLQFSCLCVSEWVWPTVPLTAVELCPHAHGGGQSGDGDQTDVAGHGGRVQVVDDGGVGVLVALHHLETKGEFTSGSGSGGLPIRM